ncbi:hypothetical protein PCASD_05836 [Puccinia coronata f. sp. avenae]|uniref:Uncharacterized protein n=1 Tax=Puccinia coronata f. sp. avenae TaxID=200324 RepID=A0A2N5V3Z2_9BASI|nr:hypothetical protein PCASD_05836 [Puccinia coronata f. sp. avenae]
MVLPKFVWIFGQNPDPTPENGMNAFQKCMNFGEILEFTLPTSIGGFQGPEACNEKISGAIEYEAGVLSGPPPIGQAAETGVIQPTNNVINALSRLRTSGLNCYPQQKTQEEKNWREIQWNNEFEIDKEI